MKIYCCQCKKDIKPIKVKGALVYPYNTKLQDLDFWMCQRCKNFVGCHPNSTRPLGVIANKEIKQMRIKIHNLLDPIWKSGKMSRKEVYKQLSDVLGWKYHTAQIKSIEQAKGIYRAIERLSNQF